jgi:hypothetical protein
MTGKLAIVAALALQGLMPRAVADSSTGPDNISYGEFTTGNWRSSDFQGSALRQWDTAGTSFSFDWSTVTGDQIGSMGVAYGSSYLGVPIDSMAPNCIMSANAAFTPTSTSWFDWSIYGFTNPTYTYFSNTANGWANEFYIVCYSDEPVSSFQADPTLVSIGSVTVDGVTYACFNNAGGSQSQWWAVRTTKTWNPSVNISEIFAYWRSKGLGNEYIVDLTWALEGFSGTGGALQLTNIQIPNLALGTPIPSFSQWEAQPGYFSSTQLTNPAISGPTATPENDGVPNLMKYLYNINPTLPMTNGDRASLPVVGTTTIGGNPYLTLTYGQNSLETGITINVQCSPDLQNWTTLTLTTGTPTSSQYIEQPTGQADPNGDPYMEIEVLLSGTKEFIRLDVTSP